MVRQKAPTRYRFRYAQGFGTRALARTLDSLVRVSRRVAYCHYASTLAKKARPSARAGRIRPRATIPRGAEFPGPFRGRPSRCWPVRRGVRRPEGPAEPRRASSDRMRFPRNDFTYCFTLFSKCFSPFDYSTCALSVSGRYLALDGIYHPLRAAFSNNSTLRRSFTRRGPPPRHGALTLCGIPSQGTRSRGPCQSTLCRLQLGPPLGGPDFKSELLPLHSPLLGQSLLVSFPPLIDMLKFSG